MYKFYVFAWNSYYPRGGLNDLKEGFNSMEDCWKYLAKETYEHYQIVDNNFGLIVEG